MILGLRTAIYPAPDLARAKAWYAQVLDLEPYFDQPFYVGFAVGGFELGLIPDGQPGVAGPQALWGVSNTWTKSLRQRFAKCVGPLGPQVQMPVSGTKPSDAEIVARVELAGPGAVSDGYRSALLVHGPSNAGYIVQIGGYAGTQTVYGPLPLASGCAGLPSSATIGAFAQGKR